MIALLAALLIAQTATGIAVGSDLAGPRDEIVLRVQEFRPADPWTQTVEGRCGRRAFSISGYGVGFPENRRPEIKVNRRPVTGETADRLIEDLSTRGAVYRIVIKCGQAGDAQSITVSRGERLEGGDMLYRVSRADFVAGRLRSYSGLETTDADGFWFR